MEGLAIEIPHAATEVNGREATLPVGRAVVLEELAPDVLAGVEIDRGDAPPRRFDERESLWAAAFGKLQAPSLDVVHVRELLVVDEPEDSGISQTQ